MDLKELLKTTLFRPMDAAQEIMQLAIKREVLWAALILSAVLNALFVSVSFHATPPTPEQAELIPKFFESPFLTAMVIAGVLVISVFTFYWAGHILGGTGRFPDVLAVTTWWQFVGLGASVVMLVLGAVSAALASSLSLIANIWALYILVGLISGAHRFETPLKGLGIIALSLVMMTAGIVVFLTVVGLAGPMEAPNV